MALWWRRNERSPGLPYSLTTFRIGPRSMATAKATTRALVRASGQAASPPLEGERVNHHTAPPPVELPAFITKLRQEDGVAARALESLILTFAVPPRSEKRSESFQANA